MIPLNCTSTSPSLVGAIISPQSTSLEFRRHLVFCPSLGRRMGFVFPSACVGHKMEILSIASHQYESTFSKNHHLSRRNAHGTTCQHTDHAYSHPAYTHNTHTPPPLSLPLPLLITSTLQEQGNFRLEIPVPGDESHEFLRLFRLFCSVANEDVPEPSLPNHDQIQPFRSSTVRPGRRHPLRFISSLLQLYQGRGIHCRS